MAIAERIDLEIHGTKNINLVRNPPPEEYGPQREERLALASSLGRYTERSIMHHLSSTDISPNGYIACYADEIRQEIGPALRNGGHSTNNQGLSTIYASLAQSNGASEPKDPRVRELFCLVDDKYGTDLTGVFQNRVEYGMYINSDNKPLDLGDDRVVREIMLRRYPIETALSIAGLNDPDPEWICGLQSLGAITPNVSVSINGRNFQLDGLITPGECTDERINLAETSYSVIEIKSLHMPRIVSGRAPRAPRKVDTEQYVNKLIEIATEAERNSRHFRLPDNVFFVYSRGALPTVVFRRVMDTPFYYDWLTQVKTKADMIEEIISAGQADRETEVTWTNLLLLHGALQHNYDIRVNRSYTVLSSLEYDSSRTQQSSF